MFKRFEKACFEVEFNSGLYYMVDKITHNFYIDFLTIQKITDFVCIAARHQKFILKPLTRGKKNNLRLQKASIWVLQSIRYILDVSSLN